MAGDESEDEWQFSVDEFDDAPEEGPEHDQHSSQETTAPHADRADGEAADEEASVAGEFAPQVPVVPEMPEPENAAFVILGSILTIIALTSVINPSFGLIDAAIIVVVVGGFGVLAYGALVRLTPEA